MLPRLYLDNAATSFPKPRSVHDAMLRYATEVGGTAGRGNYAEAREGARVINECRQRIARLVGAPSARHVVFSLNTTDALNLALKGLAWHAARTGPERPLHVVTTEMDHNSILRPLHALERQLAPRFSWTCVASRDESGLVAAEDVAAALRPETILVATLHASNVTGVLQPVAEYGRVCRERGVPLLVDAAQSLGHEPVDVQAMGIDLLAFPGHKGLLGPLGTGGLVMRPGFEHRIDPLREGGTGSRSERDTQPDELPDKFEPGSQNAVGLAGLSAGVQHLLDHAAEIYAHDRRLRAVMLEELAELDALGASPGRLGLRLLGPRSAEGRVGVFSLTHESLSPHELAAALEQDHGVLVRAGLACAPRAHQMLGTTAAGGALRFSVGPYVTEPELRRACRALGDLCRSAREGVAAPAMA